MIDFRLEFGEGADLFSEGINFLIFLLYFLEEGISFSSGFSDDGFPAGLDAIVLALVGVDLILEGLYLHFLVVFLGFDEFLMDLGEFDLFVGEFLFHFPDKFGFLFAALLDGDDVVLGLIYLFEP